MATKLSFFSLLSASQHLSLNFSCASEQIRTFLKCNASLSFLLRHSWSPKSVLEFHIRLQELYAVNTWIVV